LFTVGDIVFIVKCVIKDTVFITIGLQLEI